MVPGVNESKFVSSFRAVSPFLLALQVLWPHWFSKVDVLRNHFSGAGLGSWGAHCGVETILFMGRSSGFWVPSWLWVIELGAHLWWDCVPSLLPTSLCVFGFLLSILLFICLFVYVSLGFFPEEVVPYVVVDSVCLWEKVSSGCFYITILNPLWASLKCKSWSPALKIWFLRSWASLRYMHFTRRLRWFKWSLESIIKSTSFYGDLNTYWETFSAFPGWGGWTGNYPGRKEGSEAKSPCKYDSNIIIDPMASVIMSFASGKSLIYGRLLARCTKSI